MLTSRLPNPAPYLLICAALIYGPRVASAQETNAFGEQQQQAIPTADSSESSGKAPENQQTPPPQPVVCGPSHLRRCLKDVALDQAGIWTSPFHIHSRDAYWLVPFAGAVAVAIHYDAPAQQELGIGQGRIDTSKKISLFGSTYVTFGESGALYVVGRLTHNDHLAETGRLGAEAVIDASLVAEVLKLATNRERPNEGNGAGGFWPNGTHTFSTSFPSGHAVGSWALARVVASEYPNKLTQIGVYALATAISVSRVTAREHFPSDVLVGSVLGYLVGGYVVHHHAEHNPDFGFAFVPVVDVSTHTFGGKIELNPSEARLPNVSQLVSWMSLK